MTNKIKLGNVAGKGIRELAILSQNNEEKTFGLVLDDGTKAGELVIKDGKDFLTREQINREVDGLLNLTGGAMTGPLEIEGNLNPSGTINANNGEIRGEQVLDWDQRVFSDNFPPDRVRASRLPLERVSTSGTLNAGALELSIDFVTDQPFITDIKAHNYIITIGGQSVNIGIDPNQFYFVRGQNQEVPRVPENQHQEIRTRHQIELRPVITWGDSRCSTHNFKLVITNFGSNGRNINVDFDFLTYTIPIVYPE